MAMNNPARRRSRIIQANRRAIGGGRKRCKKGKNCSAACIAPDMECLVGLPVPVNTATSKVSQFLMTQTRGKSGVIRPQPAVNPELRAKGDALLRELRSASPKAAMNAPIAAQGRPAAQGSGGNPNWKQEFSGRTEKLDLALNKLQNTINSQPPEQQAYWNAQVSKNFGLKGDKEDAIVHSSGRDKGKPYSREEINQALTSQASGWTRIINDGAPKVLEDRQKGRFPAPANMSPNTTFTGQRKWINPEDGLVYSAPKNAADAREGLWGQNRASKKDTTRHVPAITEFRKTREAAGQAWPAQSLPPRPDMPKSVDEVINGLTATQRNRILTNGLDASGNEGMRLREFYKANPKEADARMREVVERWYAQGGRSGISGQPVAIPGLDPKPGESRSSVDHQTPISRDRKLNPSALQTRKNLDKFENFLIAEEGPNMNRETVPWSQWHDNIVAGRRRKDTSATVNEVPVKAAKKKEDTNYDNWEERKSGNYGRIKVSPDGTRAVKELLVGKDGVQGEFGPHEVELATKMGQLGHSPKVYRATDKTMEMDKAGGETLWKGYSRGENEPVMNTRQAIQAAAAIRDLHKLGFYHGDNHALQYIVDGDNVKLVDYGLSGPISQNPVKVMQDLSKISSLVRWDNPELAGNPYVQVVNKHLPAYREIKGTSKAAKAEKERIAQAYLQDLAKLPSTGGKALVKSPAASTPATTSKSTSASQQPPRQKPAPPVKKKPPEGGKPALTGIEAIEKIGDDAKLARAKQQVEVYKQKWAETIGKGDLEKTKQLSDTWQMLKKEADALQKEYDDKYNRPVAQSPKEIMSQEGSRVKDRLNSRVEEGIKNWSSGDKARIVAAREEAIKDFRRLSNDELASLGLYGENKSKYFLDVNKFLRTGSMEGIPGERQQIVRNIVSNLNGVLDKLPASSQTEFSRAVSGNGAKGLQNLKVGDIIEDKGFGSYTLPRKVQTLDQFFRTDRPNALMQVKSRNARDVSPAMEFQRESEHILRPGTRLRVVEIIPSGGPGAHSSRKVGSVPTYIFEEVE